MDLTLPLDNAAIEKILLHRYPFLFVDRITEFEVDKRIVGIKNVSHNERYLSPSVDGRPALPPTILSRCQRYAFRRIPVPVMIERMRVIAEAEGYADIGTRPRSAGKQVGNNSERAAACWGNAPRSAPP